MDSYAIMALEREREKINRMARDVAYQYLNNGAVISDFIFDEY
ncbi:hypothetical protein ACQ4OC_15845 [Yersinia sp. J1]|nr:hypothetical protein [Yersinia entomophaga]